MRTFLLGLFVCVCVFLGFELKATCMLGRCSTTWVIQSALFVLFTFKTGSLGTICPGLTSKLDPPDLCTGLQLRAICAWQLLLFVFLMTAILTGMSFNLHFLYLSCVFKILFLDRVLLSCPGAWKLLWSLAGLKLLILLCWDYRWVPPHLAAYSL
jgi:hypothetical protein